MGKNNFFLKHLALLCISKNERLISSSPLLSLADSEHLSVFLKSGDPQFASWGNLLHPCLFPGIFLSNFCIQFMLCVSS